MTENISLNANLNQINITQEVNNVSISSPGPQGPIGIADPTSSVAYATYSASSLYATNSSSAIFSSSARISSSAIYSSSSNFATTSIYAASAGISEQIHIYVKNGSGQQLYKGQAVYITSAQGANVLVGLAIASGESTSSKTLGLLQQDLAINQFGYATTTGVIFGIDTSDAGTEGDAVWLSPTIPGGRVYGITNKPSAPNHMVYLGVVTRKNSQNGAIFINVQNGLEIQELHNVYANNPSNGDVIQFNSACNLWITQAGSVAYASRSASTTYADWLGGYPASSYALQSYVNTTSANVLSQAQTYANSASLNAYNQASAFTQTTSAGLYSWINSVSTVATTANQNALTASSLALSASSGLITYVNNASAGLISYINTASSNLISYTNSASLNAYNQAVLYTNAASTNLIAYANSASLNAYNQASAFTQTASAGLFARDAAASAGLYNLIVTASSGIITSGSVAYATTAGNANNLGGQLPSYYYPAANITTASVAYATRSGSADYATNAGNSTTTSQTSFSTLSVTGGITTGGNVNVGGSLFVSGSTVAISASNITLNDPLLYLADGNPSNINDIGIVGSFTPGASNTYQHTGLVRDASDNTWKLFSGVVPEPTNTIDFTSASYDPLFVGNITASPSTGIGIRINSASGSVGLYAKAGDSSTDIQQWADSGNTVRSRINTNGSLFIWSSDGNYAAGTNLGIKASSQGSIPLSIAAATNQTADLTRWYANNGTTVLSAINASGQFYTGSSIITSAINNQNAQLGIIASSSVNTALVIKTSSALTSNNWANSGAGNIFEAIGVYGTALTLSGGGDLRLGTTIRFNSSLFSIGTGNVGNQGLIIKSAGAGGQTADLIQLQDVNSVVLSTFTGSGQLVVGSATPLISSSTAMVSIYNTSSNNPGLAIKMAGTYGTGEPPIRILDSTNAMRAVIDQWGGAFFNGGVAINNNIRVGSNALLGATLNVSNMSGSVGAIIRGSSGQTADLTQWQDSSGNVLTEIDSAGRLTVGSSQPLVSISAAMLSVYSSGSNNPGIIVRGASAQNVDYLQIQNSAGTIVSGLGSGGNAYLRTFGTNYGATLSINTANDTNIGAIVRANSASQSANLQEWQSSSGVVLARVTKDGDVAGQSMFSSYSGVGTGFANYQGASTSLYVISTSSAKSAVWVRGQNGQTANLQEWQNPSGSVIALISSTGGLTASSLSINNIATISAAGTLVLPRGTTHTIGPQVSNTSWTVNTGADNYIGIVVKGNSASQSANLQEWQTGATTQTWVASNGDLITKGSVYVQDTESVGSSTYNASTSLFITTKYAARSGIFVQGMAGQTGDLQQWQNSSGSVLSTFNASGQLIVGSATPLVSTSAAMISVYNSSSNTPGLIIRSASLQNVNIQEWQTSAGVVRSAITSDGSIVQTTTNSAFNRLTNLGVGQRHANGISVLHVEPQDASWIVSTIRGASAQTADLTQWQNSTGSVLVEIDSAGRLTVGSSQPIVSTSAAMLSVYPSASTVPGLIIQAAPNAGISGAYLQEWKTAAGATSAYIRNDGYLNLTAGLGTNYVWVNGYINGTQMSVTDGGLSSATFIIKASSGQATDLTRWIDSSNNLLAWIDKNGMMTINQQNVSVTGNGALYVKRTATFDSGASVTIPIVVLSRANQTADLTQWQNSTNVVLSAINASGQLIVGGSTVSSYNSLGTTSAMLTVIQSSSNTPGIIVKRAPGGLGIQQEWQSSTGTSEAYITYGQFNAQAYTTTGNSGGIGTAPLGPAALRALPAAGTIGLVVGATTGQTADLIRMVDIASSSILSVFNASGQLIVGSATPLISTSAAMVSIYTSASTVPGLIVRGATSQSANLQEWQDSAGNVVSRILSNGRITTNNGAVFGGQTLIGITTMYSGASGNIAAAISAAAGQTADLLRMQDSVGTVLSTFNNTGQLIVGSAAPLVSTSAAMISVYSTGSNNPGIVMRMAGTTGVGARPFVLQNNAGNTLAFIDNFGGIYGAGFGPAAQSGGFITADTGSALLFRTTSSAISPIIVRGTTNQSANLQEWQNSGGTAVTFIDQFGRLRVTDTTTSAFAFAVTATSAGTVGARIQGAAGQTANLQEWQSSGGASVVAIDPIGNITASGNVVYNQATNAQTGASYTLVLSDSGKFVERNNAGTNFVIIPSNANAAFAIGARVDIIQTGAGNTVFSASTGVTFNFYSPTSATSASMAGQWAGVTLVKRATDTWAAIGNIK